MTDWRMRAAFLVVLACAVGLFAVWQSSLRDTRQPVDLLLLGDSVLAVPRDAIIRSRVLSTTDPLHRGSELNVARRARRSGRRSERSVLGMEHGEPTAPELRRCTCFPDQVSH